jgi:nitrogen fixation-related uncharacterized protein
MIMSEATIALTALTGGLFLTFLGFFMWGIRSGQFKNIEEAKYQLFPKNTSNSNQQESESEGKRGDKR